MRQVSRRLDVGNLQWFTVNTRLSSGTSAGTFACPAGLTEVVEAKQGTKNEPNMYFVPDSKKVPEIDPHVSSRTPHLVVERKNRNQVFCSLNGMY